ncbi:hypothetical protein MIR68_000083 [Amoeboaphelidium protococcarum]|nr:hypothetical protein MIR68_000083 [Amoeboaphelidium protococcarum]
MRDIVVFGGSSHPELSRQIAQKLGLDLGKCKLGKFSNKETQVQIMESVRDMDVYIIQTSCHSDASQSGDGSSISSNKNLSLNDNLMELLIMISACKMASARKVIAVIPSFFYARQPDVPYKKSGTVRPAESASSSNYNAARDQSSSNQSPSHESYQQQQQHQNQMQLFEPAPSVRSLVNVQAEKSLRKLHEVSKHGHSQLHNEVATGAASRSQSPDRSSSLHTLPKVNILSTENDGVRRLVVSSPVQPTISQLGLVKTGYRHWVARSGTLIANMLTAAGMDHLITMDLHDAQFQGFFDCPVDNLYGSSLMVKYIRENVKDYKHAMIISPDAGGAKRSSSIANKLGMQFALIHKEKRAVNHYNTGGGNQQSGGNREQQQSKQQHGGAQHLTQMFNVDVDNQHQKHQQSADSSQSGGQSPIQKQTLEGMVLVGQVKDKVCVLIDDIADTSGTITKAAQLLKENGASRIIAIITHGVLSGDAPYRVRDSHIDEIIFSNTVPQKRNLSILGPLQGSRKKCLSKDTLDQSMNGLSVSANNSEMMIKTSHAGKLGIFDVSGMFAEAIRRIHHGESLSSMFGSVET